jgi:hypothetical protein
MTIRVLAVLDDATTSLYLSVEPQLAVFECGSGEVGKVLPLLRFE